MTPQKNCLDYATIHYNSVVYLCYCRVITGVFVPSLHSFENILDSLLLSIHQPSLTITKAGGCTVRWKKEWLYTVDFKSILLWLSMISAAYISSSCIGILLTVTIINNTVIVQSHLRSILIVSCPGFEQLSLYLGQQCLLRYVFRIDTCVCE